MLNQADVPDARFLLALAAIMAAAAIVFSLIALRDWWRGKD